MERLKLIVVWGERDAMYTVNHLHLVIKQTLLSRATYSKYRDILPGK